MPLDRGVVEQQLRAIGEGAHWWNVRELRDLPQVLHEDEQILAIGTGRISRLRLPRRPWLVVVTPARLLLLRSYADTGWRHLEAAMHLIERGSLRTGPFSGRVRLVVGGRAMRVVLSRDQAYRVHDAVAAHAAVARGTLAGIGAGSIVRRMVDHVLAMPAVAFSPATAGRLPAAAAVPAPGDAELEQRVQALEEQVERLQEQVEFLEQLLRERQVRSGPGG